MTCCAEPDTTTPGTPKRRRSFDNGSPDNSGLNLSEEPVLIPLLEDLTIWLSGFLSTQISPENFIELCEDGVLFCKLAKVLHEKAVEYKSRTNHSYPLPSYSIKKWYENPKIGSFFCRDNVCKFINWCKQFGVSEICLFESNDIVEHRTVRALRNVLICLLDVGKIGVKHGIEPSELVRIELEIEQEIQQEILRAKHDILPTRKSRIPRKNSSLNSSLASSSEPPSSEEEEEEVVCSSPEPDEEELERIRLKLLSLDEQVRAIVSRCTCKTPFQLDRVGDGKYKLPNTSQIFFVRILRNHVMVRVGGGWDTLDHFIAKHDPCRMKFKQISGTPNTREAKSKIDCWSSEPRRPRNRSSSLMITSSPLRPSEQPWLQEDVSPVAKVPRQHKTPGFGRSASARYIRKLSYSSESEDLNYVAPVCGGSEGSTSSLPDSEFDHIEEKMVAVATFSPLISFRKKSGKKAAPQEKCLAIHDEFEERLTSFNQTPTQHSSRAPRSEISRKMSAPARSMIPVPKSRSKSCERKGSNTVSNTPALKHSKSGEVHRNKIVMTPQRKLSTPITPSCLAKQSTKSKEEQLQACLAKTPRSLLSNPTSATARKVLRSKSSENMAQHFVVNSPAAVMTPQRGRSKSGDGAMLNKVSLARKPKSKSLKKSRSTEVMKHNIVSLHNRPQEIIMKPDLDSRYNTPRSNGRSFVDWLKKRRNEN